MTLSANVNNLPSYATRYKFVVARNVDGELWFWGAYDERENADEAAESIKGIVLEVRP